MQKVNTVSFHRHFVPSKFTYDRTTDAEKLTAVIVEPLLTFSAELQGSIYHVMMFTLRHYYSYM